MATPIATSSGNGASVSQKQMPDAFAMNQDATVAFDEEEYEEVLAAGARVVYRTLKMTAKVPSASDRHVQSQGYFAY